MRLIKNNIWLFATSWILASLMGFVYIFMFPLRDFDVASDSLVINSLLLPDGHPRKGHLLVGDDKYRVGGAMLEIPWVVEQLKNDQPMYYLKQYGLQAQILDKIQNIIGWHGQNSIIGSRLCQCIIHGFVFSILVVGISVRRQKSVAIVFLLLALCWPGFWRWVPSLYWQAGLTLAIFVWFLFAKTRNTALLLAVGFFLFLLRFLCGYEYLTSISLGAIVCLMGNFALRSENVKKIPLIAVWFTSVVAFFTAASLHSWRIAHSGASLSEAVDIIVAPALYRTIGAGEVGTPALSMLANLISVFFQHGTLLLIVLTIFLLPSWVRQLGLDDKECTIRTRFSILLGLSFIASMSWQILAIGHSGQHPHLNNVVFLQPLAIFLFWILAECCSDIQKHIGFPIKIFIYKK